MLTVTTSSTLDPELLGTGFVQTRYFVATGRGYRHGSDFEPTSILPIKIEDETFKPLSYAQIQSIAENDLRNDLKQHFGSYLFQVELFHLAPLPATTEATVFVSAYVYSDFHKIRVAKTFPVRVTESWAVTMDSILDLIEEESKPQLANSAPVDARDPLLGYGVDWLTFTVLG